VNLHTPERQPDETQAQYRQRQSASRAAVVAMTKGPTQAPAVNQLDVLRFWLGQHTNDRKNARRAVKAAIGARQYRKQRQALARAAQSQVAA